VLRLRFKILIDIPQATKSVGLDGSLNKLHISTVLIQKYSLSVCTACKITATYKTLKPNGNFRLRNETTRDGSTNMG
jgi:hypothetical protein